MIFALIVIVAVSNYAYLVISPYYRPVYSGYVWADNKISEEEAMLSDFVKNKLTGDDKGIYTNYLDEENDGDTTKGHSVLSESEGLILLYNLERNNKEEFDANLNYITQNMLMENDLLSWRVDNGVQNNTSASIDDLRVIKALLLADEKWNDISYRKLALKIAGGVHKELIDNYRLSNFNDGYAMSDETKLCYLDLPTLRMLSNIDYRNWKEIYDKSMEILNGGYISDEVPLYSMMYYKDTNTYDSDNPDTLVSMITILNKLDDAQDVSKSIAWIKEKFKKDGKIFTSYSRENGEPVSDIESTSAYSMIVQIASRVGDYELEAMAADRMKAFQIKNPKSKIYGGFGNENGSHVYSYDNLNALIAFSRTL